MRTLLALVLVLGVTACGSSGGTSASKVSFTTGSSSAAGIAPADALAYFAVDTTLDSTQWKQVGTLLSRFPDRTKLVTQLLSSWKSNTKTSFQADVKPGLGEQLDGVVFSKTGGGLDFVALLQPKDESAFKRLVAKLDASDPSNAVAVGDFRGWKVIGQSQASISAFEAATKTSSVLADDATFKDAVGNLSKDALATVYANASQLTSALLSAFPQASNVTGQNGKLQWAAADVTATGDGLRLDGVAKSAALKSTPAPEAATLLRKIPADALGVLSFNGDTFRSQSAQLPKALQQGLGVAGTPVPGLQRLIRTYAKLASAFAHENALYVRRGSGPFPEVTLVTVPDHPASVNAAVDNAVRQLDGINAFPEQITIGTVAAHMYDLGRVSIYWGVDQGRFVVTTNQQAFADLRGNGAKLADDATFKEAKTASGMPDATDGFLYVNLTQSIQTIESFAQAAGSKVPPEVQNNLRPLHTAVAWSSNDGAIGKFSVFVGIN